MLYLKKFQYSQVCVFVFAKNYRQTDIFIKARRIPVFYKGFLKK